jgi:transposase, IS5 family
LHGEETRIWGDRAYQGEGEVIRKHAANAKDLPIASISRVVDAAEKARNRTKSKVRAKVERSIGVIKRVFGFAKVRYRGPDKNAHRLFVTAALANLFIIRYQLRCA